MIRDFERYIHMRAFDETVARPYSDDPRQLNAILAELEARGHDFAARRARAVATLTYLPLGRVVERACETLEPMVGPGTEAMVREPLEATR